MRHEPIGSRSWIINNFILPVGELTPGDTVVVDCIPDSALVSAAITNGAGMGPYSYEWSNGSTNDTTIFYDAGVNNAEIPFSVTMTDGCGSEYVRNGLVMVKKTLIIDSLWTLPSAACNPTGVVSGFISGPAPPQNGNGLVYEWKGPGMDDPDSVYASVWSNLSSGWYYFTAN